MEKIYDCVYAKRKLRNDGVMINGKVPHQAKYQTVIIHYFKKYNEYPPLKKIFGKASPKQVKERQKPKKGSPLTEDQKWWADYKKYIHSDKWKAFRRLILHKYSHTCQKCFRKFKAGFLHVHHLHYKNFKNEKEEDVLLVCNDCHHEIHVEKNRAKKSTTKP